MMLTGSEHLSASMTRGQTSLHGEIEKTHSALVRTCTALVIWSNGSSTRSSSAGVWRPATTNSQPTTSHSSRLPQYGHGSAFMSTGPSLGRTRGEAAAGGNSVGSLLDADRSAAQITSGGMGSCLPQIDLGVRRLKKLGDALCLTS